jgi:hypothetical protein
LLSVLHFTSVKSYLAGMKVIYSPFNQSVVKSGPHLARLGLKEGQPSTKGIFMAETISKNNVTQIIGGTFSNRENADRAVQAFRDLGIPEQNLQVVVQLSDRQANDAYTDTLRSRGFAESQAVFYDKAIREGKTLVAVHNVIDAAPVIDVFDRFGAEFNPSGSRNLRDDVLGMTVGAGAGAVALGVAGAAVAGPLGAAVGVAAGVVLGGGAGTAAGKAAEHNK